jgi:hypothetical protein
MLKSFTGAKTINVKALPESGKPLDFSGAVGSFNSKYLLNESEEWGRNDLIVSVTGKGNMKLFSY